MTTRTVIFEHNDQQWISVEGNQTLEEWVATTTPVQVKR